MLRNFSQMNNELNQIETELKKRLIYPYKWGRKQNDQFDKLTNFIYRTFLFDDVTELLVNRLSWFKKDWVLSLALSCTNLS